jgi:hypothetical protein
MTDKYLTSFLIGFSLMFVAHYFLEPTWGIGEERPRSLRMIFNYAIGTAGICVSFLYMHPALWLDLGVSVAGAAIATVLAHSRDGIADLLKRDKANGLIENSEKKA